MKTLLKFLFVLSPFIVLAQSNSPSFKVSYSQISNGEKSDTEISILYENEIVFLTQADAKIHHYIDFKNKENVSVIQYEGQLYKNMVGFSDLPKAILEEGKEEKILGYTCKYASYLYFSNTVEVWYTEETKAKGSPYSRFLPNSNALALKIVVNGNREIIASSIEKLKERNKQEYLAETAKEVTEAEFEELKINSRFIVLPIFDNEIVNFDNDIKAPEEKELKANQTYHFSKGSVIMKKIKLTDELKSSEQVFAKLNCRSNGDAYDRTGSVFIIPADKKRSMLSAFRNGLEELPVYIDNEKKEYQGIVKAGDYNPPTELIRFFTSFGADHFNKLREINNYPWERDVIYKQEVSALIPNDKDEVWIGVFVGNYDKGGHIVSLDLNFHPVFEEESNAKKYIQPLFSTINTLEMSGQNYGRLFGNDTLRVEFEIYDEIDNLQLLYTSTGHGGWGNGDEFNPKLNRILIDGKEVFKIVPWRTDCATYRLYNPASGNFSNGVSSSDLSRSNWCPAMLTPPYIVPLEDIKKGKHILEVIIDQGEDEGNSFSHWGLSGVLTGNIISKK